MEALEAISADFSKLVDKQQQSTVELDSTLDELIQSLENARSEVEKDPGSLKAHLALLKQKSTACAKKMTSAQEEVRRAVMRHEKTLRGSFKTDLNNVWDPKAFEGKEEVLNKVIALHLIREGRFGLAEAFVQEAGLQLPAGLQEEFVDLYHILESLRAFDLGPAIEWTVNHREQLTEWQSTLEFELHKLQFIQYLTKGRREEALQYARQNLGRFSSSMSSFKEIQRLMCCFLYTPNLEDSPYCDVMDPNAWLDIEHHFNRDFCQLLGLSSESPLYVAVMVGTLALPTIIKMSSIMKDKSGLEWSQAGELPVEIPLLSSQRYHSVFACPVSKEQSTEENPPIMLVCGHVICKCCVDRLCKGNHNTRFKCPYCPTESTANQANRIYV
ncbi:hypothetical protein HDU85_006935 [Gaertneriomyces sp. JEL0708]|nr:hypothetical protein HDU85_006935 [Gaertneriomyces sp. JEL0708]